MTWDPLNSLPPAPVVLPVLRLNVPGRLLAIVGSPSAFYDAGERGVLTEYLLKRRHRTMRDRPHRRLLQHEELLVLW